MKKTEITKLKRRLEIAFLIISNPTNFYDLSFMFNVNEATINRDMTFLRSIGLPIHRKNNMYHFQADTEKEKELANDIFQLKELMLKYKIN